MLKAAIYLSLFLVACGDDGATPGLDATPEASCVPSTGPLSDVVTTTSGTLRGARAGETFAFKRVPFAAPPVGDQRFRAPAAPACPAEELDATSLGPACPQLDGDTFTGDEDCLHLNVWAPAASAAPRPVMVWIHGGGNTQGSAVYPIYDGRRLAEAGDVVVVSVNYRLGQLGFLGHASFAAESPDGGQGTFGLLDQIAALRWVHDNIASFGGDPSNVTIFGESAGARDACALVAAPPAAGLFHRALMASGACKFLPTRTAAEQTGADVAAAVGCGGADVLACLRTVSAEALIRALPADISSLSSSPYNPMIDGLVLPAQPEAVIAAGNHHRVPFAIGANADETGNSVPAITTVAQYEAAVRALLPQSLADMALAQYPAASYPTPRAAYVRLTTDARFVCPSREIAKTVDAAQTEPVYRYFFQYRASPLGAVHGLDVPYTFGTFDAVLVNGQPYQPNATDLALSATMMGYWTRFARSGDPGGAPAWPPYDTSDPALVLDAVASTANNIRDADCDFWAPYYSAF